MKARQSNVFRQSSAAAQKRRARGGHGAHSCCVSRSCSAASCAPGACASAAAWRAIAAASRSHLFQLIDAQHRPQVDESRKDHCVAVAQLAHTPNALACDGERLADGRRERCSICAPGPRIASRGEQLRAASAGVASCDRRTARTCCSVAAASRQKSAPGGPSPSTSSASVLGVKVAMWCARSRNTRGGKVISSARRGVLGLGDADDMARI